MRPRDWLMLLVAIEGAPAGLDPVRLQKGLFLLAPEARLPPGERYSFVPYNYGPMSPARRSLIARPSAACARDRSPTAETSPPEHHKSTPEESPS